MEENNKQKTVRNVTAKDLLVAGIVIVLLVFVGWYKEAGEKWAALIFAVVPIIGVLVYLKIPREKRIKAEKEFSKTKTGKVLNYFMWIIYALAGALLVKFIFSWATSA